MLIAGGGQAGIALGARLRQLRVPAIIVGKRGRPGDQWRGRYNKSLCLHDPVWYDRLPYLKFPANWPVFSPKDKIADWLESYTTIMELNLPSFPGMGSFRGDQHHSSAYPGPAAYRGKRCVVVGSNNSAFDICGALWENGADVTMVQRSSTHIVKSATLSATDLVADGEVKLAQGRVDHLTSSSLVLSDGTELPADLVVYATGYTSVNGWAAELIPRRWPTGSANAGGWARARPRIPGPGRARNATCGSPPIRRRSGSTAATCTSRGTLACLAAQGAAGGHPDAGVRSG